MNDSIYQLASISSEKDLGSSKMAGKTNENLNKEFDSMTPFSFLYWNEHRKDSLVSDPLPSFSSPEPIKIDMKQKIEQLSYDEHLYEKRRVPFPTMNVRIRIRIPFNSSENLYLSMNIHSTLEDLFYKISEHYGSSKHALNLNEYQFIDLSHHQPLHMGQTLLNTQLFYMENSFVSENETSYWEEEERRYQDYIQSIHDLFFELTSLYEVHQESVCS